MFKSIGRYIEHLLAAMVKGFIVMGVAAAIITLGAFLLLTPTHHLPNSPIEIVMTVLVVGLAALLGMTIGLVWRLTHIEELTHALSQLTHSGEERRQ